MGKVFRRVNYLVFRFCQSVEELTDKWVYCKLNCLKYESLEDWDTKKLRTISYFWSWVTCELSCLRIVVLGENWVVWELSYLVFRKLSCWETGLLLRLTHLWAEMLGDWAAGGNWLEAILLVTWIIRELRRGWVTWKVICFLRFCYVGAEWSSLVDELLRNWELSFLADNEYIWRWDNWQLSYFFKLLET